MLKLLPSRIIIYTLALGIVYPLFKPYPVEAISFSFYQWGFGDNGFLKGTFSGSDNDNDGYISFDECTYFLGYKCDYVFSNPDNIDEYEEYEEVYEKTDRGYVSMDFFSDHSDRVNLDTGDIASFSWTYSISSNQLTGYTSKLYSGVRMSQKETCVWGDWINVEYYDDYKDYCNTSPLVIVSQGLPSKPNSGNNSSGDDSSTKVPEPSLSLSLLAVGLLSAGSALLRSQKP